MSNVSVKNSKMGDPCWSRRLQSAQGACCLCLDNSKSCTSIQNAFQLDNEVLLYSQMIEICFCIKMSDAKLKSDNCMICKDCIRQLMRTWMFFSQIKATQIALQGIKATVKVKEEREEINPLKLDTFHIYLKNEESLENNINSENSNLSMPYFDDGESSESTLPPQCTTPIVIRRKLTSAKKLPAIQHCTKETIEKKPYVLNKTDLSCKFCNETFAVHNTLVNHMGIHFPNHICEVCAKPFTTMRKLSRHIQIHKNDEITCEICNKILKNPSYLRKHMLSHSGEQAYKCQVCQERFKSYHLRARHLINQHGDEPLKYKCKQCPKRYFQASGLRHHIRRTHLQVREKICDECGMAFYDLPTLSKHMLKHTGVKDFKCEVCQKCYPRKYSLNEHMKIHNNIRDYECTVCGKRFIQKGTLKVHMKAHEKNTGDQNIKLEVST